MTVRVNGSLRRLAGRGPGYLPLTGIRKVRTLVVVARDRGRATRTVFRTALTASSGPVPGQ